MLNPNHLVLPGTVNLTCIVFNKLIKGVKMKPLRTLLIIVLINACLFLTQTALACHKGGAMGMASEDPLNSTIDYSSGSTFVFASTSGTLGCENWDFVKNNRMQYLDLAWNKLSEEVAQGKGEHTAALSGMYGCNGEYQQTFESLLYGNYPHLFLEMKEIDSYERAHLLDYEINRLIEVNKIGEKCSYFSSS